MKKRKAIAGNKIPGKRIGGIVDHRDGPQGSSRPGRPSSVESADYGAVSASEGQLERVTRADLAMDPSVVLRRHGPETPYRELAAAVLLQAISDLASESKAAEEIAASGEAEEFLLGEEEFRTQRDFFCHWLEIDEEALELAVRSGRAADITHGIRRTFRGGSRDEDPVLPVHRAA